MSIRQDSAKRRFRIFPITAMAMLCGSVVASAAGVTNLRCEYLTNPIGIDAPRPRLGWVIESDRRGERQTGYQVLVASTAELLARDEGDLWDSGKVASDQSIQVEYGGPSTSLRAGKPLESRQQCYWKVRVWLARRSLGEGGDKDGKPSPWSQPAARWTMGLLEPASWSAKWIEAAPAPGKTVKLVIQRATYGTADAGGSMDVTATLAAAVKPDGLRVLVDNDAFGRDPIYGKPKRLHIEYELDGKAGAQDVPEGERLGIPEGLAAEPTTDYLRRAFVVDKPVRRATLYVTALGLYEMSLNGKRIGDHMLAPDWTDYRKRVRYQTYDVTAMLRRGENALGALTANGWYAGHIGNGGFQHYGKKPALFAQLEVVYDDGASERIVTDAAWKNHASPILSTDFMLGENYDARMELPGWNKSGFDDTMWTPVKEVQQEPRPLESQAMEPVRQLAELPAKSVTEPKPGRWTFDLGQNMVGVVRLRVSAPAGTKVTLRHAEVLNPDGTLYTANLRRAPSVDSYICKGGVEVWQPKFTFHGFRYVELTGLPGKPGLETVTGIVIGSDTPRTGEFTCSDPRINQLYSNIVWGQRGNYLSVPTDCPQRDERLGWMGDAQVFVRTATYNADVAAFFTKWMVDVDDAQTSDGAFTDTSPRAGSGHGTPAWADAGVICPWTIYQVYGDARLLEKHYPSMVKWIERCRAHSNGLIRETDRGNDFGDWLAIGANTPKDVIGTAYFAYSTRLVAKAAKALGRTDDAAKYEQLFHDIKAAFNRKYVAADGRIHGNTQCCYVMALKFDLLSDEMRTKAVQYLVEDITARKDHLSTGFVGVSYLLPVLTQAGKLDTVFKLFLQDTFPSWLFSVKHGATTIWERWDGWTPGRGFQDPGMNSFNHYSLGSCGEWMFSTLAGIESDVPGFKHIVIRPRPGGGITRVKAGFSSIHGLIKSSWKIDGSRFTLDVTIPPNTTATVYVSAKDKDSVTENGNPVDKAEGVKFIKMDGACAIFEVESGNYSFVTT